MSILTIIPARGGSKGVPGKNVKEIAGKPLLSWSIISAKHDLPMKNRIVVSTDCENIASVAKNYNAEVPFLRPNKYSDDFASTESVMEHCVNWLEENEGYKPQHIILLQPTSPVRRRESISNAFEYYLANNCDSLLSVCEFSHFLWGRKKGGVEPGYDIYNRPRRQDIGEDEKLYLENGSIYISSYDSFIKSRNRLGGKIGMFEMHQAESYEIDTQLDFVVCESILKSQESGDEIYK